MVADYSSFKYGTTNYPLSTGTGATLLRDADSALYFLIDYYAAVIARHIGPRLMAEAASGNIDAIRVPVAETLPLNPEPFLTEGHIKFPLLAAYRKNVKTQDIGGQKHAVSELDVAYILPPLQYGEAERLMPILYSVYAVLDNRTEQGMDPLYTPEGGAAGDNVWETAGVATVEVKNASFGSYAGIDGLPYPSVLLHVELKEKSDIDTSELDTFAGESFTIDVADPIQPTVSDFIQVDDHAPPTLGSLSPSTGSKIGGTSVTLTGTGFVVGTTPTVYFGGIAATNVVVTSATTATCVTPAHDAYDTFAADVEYVAADGQSDTLDASFTFTTP